MRHRKLAGLALAATTAVFGLTAPAHALDPVPPSGTVIGPQVDLNLQSVTDTAFHAKITPLATAVAPATIDPAGYGYACAAGGVQSPADTGPTGHQCTWPTLTAADIVTVSATDSSGLMGGQQESADTNFRGPRIQVAATSGTGANQLKVTVDTTGTAVQNAGGVLSVSVDCGNGTAGVPSGAVFTCSYTANGAVKIQVNAKDTVNNLSSFRQLSAFAFGKPDVFRIFGPTRYETGTALSQKNWAPLTDTTPGAKHPKAVVLARGDDFADALAGVPLAVKKGGPLLITPPNALDGGVLAEIQRILPKTGPNNTIYVLGGPVAIAPAIVAQLQGLGYNVARFGGVDRFGTALLIAQDPNAMANPPRVAVATGLNFPDALSAGPLAALPGVNGAIVLSQDRVLDPVTAAYVKGKLGAGGNVFAIGGQAVAAVATIPGSAGLVTDVAGADRYATAAFVSGLGGAASFSVHAPVGVATGLQFADALTGGAFIAQAQGPILLTDPLTLSDATKTVLVARAANGLPEVDIFGGPVAVSPGVATAIAASINGVLH